MNLQNDPSLHAFSIAAVARDTGLGKDTLRVWERRYGFPAPNRDAHGERCYPASQLEKLRLIKRLIDQGHRPGRIVAQSVDALHALSRDESGQQPNRLTQAMAGHGDELASYIALLQAQEIDGLQRKLTQVLAHVGLQRWVTEVVAPLTVRVGEAWARGDLAVYEEHLYTECVTHVLRQAISALPQRVGADAPRVLLTTFPLEAHGLGLLMAEGVMTLHGCRCVSLGTQTPVRDIAQAAMAHRIDVVALSFSAHFNPNQALDGLATLQMLLPVAVQVWVGGQAPVLHRRPMAHVRVLTDLNAIEDAVNHWRNPKPDVAQARTA
jgi:DNA-binding transcriptional MerR regulator/methylmalonyl-CoA mutase cobalamin-binding subunit